MDFPDRSFAEIVRDLREFEHLSQDDFAALIAELCGCEFSVRTLQAWEAGRATPTEWARKLLISAVQNYSLEREAGRHQPLTRRRRIRQAHGRSSPRD